MPLTRQQKEERVTKTTKDLEGAASYVFVAYDGLNVTDMGELRGLLHEQGANLRVLPKRLLRIVMQNIKQDFDPTTIKGQVAIAWGNDVVAPAKVLYDFAKTRAEILQLVGGAIEGTLLEKMQVIALAQLPGKDQLRAQLLSVMMGPTRGLVTTLSGVQRNFVYGLKALADKKQAA
jgi:large subunit ribosomal protein L10